MKYTYALILLCLVNFSVASVDKVFLDFVSQNSTPTMKFKMFHYIFQKPYSLNSEFALERYKVFKSNLERFEEHNKKNLGYELGINNFADLTVEEFKKQYLGGISKEIMMKHLNKNEDNRDNENDHRLRDDDNNDQDEHRLKKKVNFDFMAEEDDRLETNSTRFLSQNSYKVQDNTSSSSVLKYLKISEDNGTTQELQCTCTCKASDDKKNDEKSDNDPQSLNFVSKDHSTLYPVVKNQGNCGSCWAFAVVGVVEGIYNLKYNKYQAFSEQSMVDCDISNDGCDGGWYVGAFDYVKSKGLPKESEYSYIDRVGTCKKYSQAVKMASYNACCDDYCYGISKCSDNFLNAMINKGPYATIIDANGIMSYTKGVFPSTECYEINHAVIATKIDRINGHVWIRNSWGKNWGINGYAQVKIENSTFKGYENVKACYLLNYGFQPNSVE